MQNRAFIVYTLILMISFSGCYKENIVKQSDVILEMKASPLAIEADGVSKSVISIELPEKTVDATNSIVLTTTKGLFDIVSKNTITVAAQNVTIDGKIHKIASATLVSTIEEGPATVSATIKSYSQTQEVNFTRAYADQIKVSVDKLNYQAGSAAEVNVTVSVKRNTGKGTVSSGQVIELQAKDQAGNDIGYFRNKNLALDATGNCINYFSLPATGYTGTVSFIATIVNSGNGSKLMQSTSINITK